MNDDVLFLFDSGFTSEQIVALKGIPLDEVEAIIGQRRKEARVGKQRNVIRDVGNKNPWKDGIPEREIVQKMVQSVAPGTVDPETYGARTVPSKTIKQTDRSDRIGEDTKLTDRVQAAANADGLDDEAAKIFEDIEFKRRQKKRKKLEGAMKDIKDMVDDDFDF